MTPRLAIALAVAAVIVAATGWALLERSARLACAVRAAELEGAYQVLAGAAQRQSAAIAELEAEGAARRDKGRQATNAAEVEAKPAEHRLDALAPLIASPTPAGGGCREALAVIRGKLLIAPAESGRRP